MENERVQREKITIMALTELIFKCVMLLAPNWGPASVWNPCTFFNFDLDACVCSLPAEQRTFPLANICQTHQAERH